jgi:RNA polymerase sigma-70 factor (ECF subfamily)
LEKEEDRWRAAGGKLLPLWEEPMTERVDTPASAEALSDHSLLQRYRRGNQDAATQLYLRYAWRLRELARGQLAADLKARLDLDDIVQSVFGSFFRRAGRGYYDVPVGEELWRLFLVIALHKIRNQGAFHRAAKRDVRRTTGEAALEEAESAGHALAFLQLAVDEALALLPAAQRQMVELRVGGHGVAEISAQTGRSRRTVERLLQEARKRLGELLDEGP